MKKTFILGLLSLMGLVAHGQTEASLAADTIALGDQTTLTIGRTGQYPSTDMLSQGGILALSQSFDTASGTQTTVITSFEPGTHYIHYGPDDSLALTVTDVVIDSADAQLRDIAPLQRVPYTFWEIFRWVLLALGVGGVAFGVWWLLTHRHVVEQVLGTAAPVDTRNPYERAVYNLEDLRQKRLWQAGKIKEYHTELTDIVRRFIEEATGIRATDMTSDETVEALSLNTKHLTLDTAPLRDIFATADMVKFAKSEPLPHEHEASMQRAASFVESLWKLVKPQEDATPDKEKKEATDE